MPKSAGRSPEAKAQTVRMGDIGVTFQTMEKLQKGTEAEAAEGKTQAGSTGGRASEKSQEGEKRTESFETQTEKENTAGNNGEKENQSSGGYTVEACSIDGWVSAQAAELRVGSIQDDARSIAIFYGDPITVTGVLKKDGADTGWYVVDVDWDETESQQQKLYLPASCFTENLSDMGSHGITLTEEQMVIYDLQGGSSNYINKATNGNWYSSQGHEYKNLGGAAWLDCTDGTTWTETKIGPLPESPSERSDVLQEALGNTTVVSMTITDEADQNRIDIYYDPIQKIWENEAGEIYEQRAQSIWRAPDGTDWYQLGTSPGYYAYEQIMLQSQDGQTQELLYHDRNSDGWINEAGEGFAQIAEGQWVKNGDEEQVWTQIGELDP